jgi:hypothetical protein
MGIKPENILCASAPEVSCDRTWASALAVRRLLDKKGLHGTPCNLYALGGHTRRSLYLYRRAFGENWPVGAVSLESSEYDLERWWSSSLAFKHIINEWISWIYTRCTFWKYTPSNCKQ